MRLPPFFIKIGGLHLSTLDCVQQLRPSLHYLDLNDAVQRGGNASAPSDMSGKGKSITVSVREQAADSRGGSFTAPGAPSRDQIFAPLIEAEQEPWVDLKWNAENVSRVCMCVHSTNGSADYYHETTVSRLQLVPRWKTACTPKKKQAWLAPPWLQTISETYLSKQNECTDTTQVFVDTGSLAPGRSDQQGNRANKSE